MWIWKYLNVKFNTLGFKILKLYFHFIVLVLLLHSTLHGAFAILNKPKHYMVNFIMGGLTFSHGYRRRWNHRIIVGIELMMLRVMTPHVYQLNSHHSVNHHCCSCCGDFPWRSLPGGGALSLLAVRGRSWWTALLCICVGVCPVSSSHYFQSQTYLIRYSFNEDLLVNKPNRYRSPKIWDSWLNPRGKELNSLIKVFYNC